MSFLTELEIKLAEQAETIRQLQEDVERLTKLWQQAERHLAALLVKGTDA